MLVKFSDFCFLFVVVVVVSLNYKCEDSLCNVHNLPQEPDTQSAHAVSKEWSVSLAVACHLNTNLSV